MFTVTAVAKKTVPGHVTGRGADTVPSEVARVCLGNFGHKDLYAVGELLSTWKLAIHSLGKQRRKLKFTQMTTSATSHG